MANVETDTSKIVQRLHGEGWILVGGVKHDKFEHPNAMGATMDAALHDAADALRDWMESYVAWGRVPPVLRVRQTNREW